MSRFAEALVSPADPVSFTQKAVQHFEDRGVARLGARGEGLVEAFAAEAGALGDRAHAPGPWRHDRPSQDDVRFGPDQPFSDHQKEGTQRFLSTVLEAC
jgi:hypothetical protein